MQDTGSRASVTARDIAAEMDRLAPPELAMDKDVIGLQVGRMNKPVHHVTVALDASPEAIQFAVNHGSDMLVTHHALLYRPAAKIDTETARGRALANALANDLTVFNAHTNLDVVDGGVNDVLAELMALQDVEILDVLQREQLMKIVVYVPESHKEAVMHAMCEQGAGHIGQYSHCTFQVHGQGTFLPGASTSPFIGEPGVLERVEEARLETVAPKSRLAAVLQSMQEAHPYEEVAYDVYPLLLKGKESGIGRVGNLKRTVTLKEFAETVRSALQLDHIRFGGDPLLEVYRVAVLGGSGSRWAEQALARGAQVLVTADCDHHSVADAWQDGLAIIDATHAAMERPVLQTVKAHLDKAFGSAIKVEIADIDEDPFHWL